MRVCVRACVSVMVGIRKYKTRYHKMVGNGRKGPDCCRVYVQYRVKKYLSLQKKVSGCCLLANEAIVFAF